MLLLLFETNDGRYALPTDVIVKVVPYVKIKKIPNALEYVAGFINYQGKPVPVLDACVLSGGESCKERFSTRIILVNYLFTNQEDKVLGLLAERVTETIKVDRRTGDNSRILIDETIYSSTPGSDNEEMIQYIDLKRLVPEQIANDIFKL